MFLKSEISCTVSGIKCACIPVKNITLVNTNSFLKDFLQIKVVCAKARVINKVEYNTLCGDIFYFILGQGFLCESIFCYALKIKKKTTVPGLLCAHSHCDEATELDV